LAVATHRPLASSKSIRSSHSCYCFITSTAEGSCCLPTVALSALSSTTITCSPYARVSRLMHAGTHISCWHAHRAPPGSCHSILLLFLALQSLSLQPKRELFALCPTPSHPLHEPFPPLNLGGTSPTAQPHAASNLPQPHATSTLPREASRPPDASQIPAEPPEGPLGESRILCWYEEAPGTIDLSNSSDHLALLAAPEDSALQALLHRSAHASSPNPAPSPPPPQPQALPLPLTVCAFFRSQHLGPFHSRMRSTPSARAPPLLPAPALPVMFRVQGAGCRV
jgi:hypothetical protein